MNTLFDATDGLVTLGPQLIQLRRRFVEQMERWAAAARAEPIDLPALVSVRDMKTIDYFDNFPHLAGLLSSLDPERIPKRGYQPQAGQVPAADLRDAGYLLPSSACHPLYFHLRGQALPETRVFYIDTMCYRNEAQYTGLTRLRMFQMYEVVCFGQPDEVKAFLSEQRHMTAAYLERLGIPFTIDTGVDPFFDSSGPRALMAREFPSKEEILVDGVAVASVNFHRNFFGDRSAIRLTDGSAAYSGCIGWGVERWLHVLLAAFGSDPDAICAAMQRVAAEPLTRQA